MSKLKCAALSAILSAAAIAGGAGELAEYDKNFVTEAFEGRQLRFYPASSERFEVVGLTDYQNGEPFRRMPSAEAEKVSPGVGWGSANTAGGVMRFRTDSKVVALQAELCNTSDMNHMPRTGSGGFDCYRLVDGEWRQTANAAPNPGQTQLSTKLFASDVAEMREYLLHFPLYGGVKSLSIGVEPEAEILPSSSWRYPGTVLFYGSSITQGGCADRSGNAYTNMLGRLLDCRTVNLGFSGCAKGEAAMAAYIARQPMRIFVMDYDWNAERVEDLQATHAEFFKIIRAAQPDLPIVLVSRCDVYPGDAEAQERRTIIERTWQEALAAGDRNVYYIDGESFFSRVPREMCMVDGCHPNTLGFYEMSRVFEPVLRTILDKAQDEDK